MDLNRDSINLRKDLRVCTLNTRTLVDPSRVEEVCAFAAKRDIDILCVQEHRIQVKSTASDQVHSRALEGGWLFCFASAGENAHGGVGVFLSPKLSPLLEGSPKVVSNRLTQLQLGVNPGSSLYIVCCYAPAAPRDEPDKEAFYASSRSSLLEKVHKSRRTLNCSLSSCSVETSDQLIYISLPDATPNFTRTLARTSDKCVSTTSLSRPGGSDPSGPRRSSFALASSPPTTKQ